MKKLVSLVLILSILSCNFSVLADFFDGAISRQSSIQKENKSTLATEVSSKPVSHNFKKVLRKAWPFLMVTVALGSSYLTYKVCNKIGLTKEIKNVIESIGKTKILKKLLIGGFIGAFATGCLACCNIERFIDTAILFSYGAMIFVCDPWNSFCPIFNRDGLDN